MTTHQSRGSDRSFILSSSPHTLKEVRCYTYKPSIHSIHTYVPRPPSYIPYPIHQRPPSHVPYPIHQRPPSHVPYPAPQWKAHCAKEERSTAGTAEHRSWPPPWERQSRSSHSGTPVGPHALMEGTSKTEGAPKQDPHGSIWYTVRGAGQKSYMESGRCPFHVHLNQRRLDIFSVHVTRH